MTDKLSEYIQNLVPLCDIKKESNLKDLYKNLFLGKMEAGKYLFKSSIKNEFTYYLLEGEVALVDVVKKETSLKSGTTDCRYPVGYEQSNQYSAQAVTDITYLKINSETLDVLLTWDHVTTPLLKKPSRSNDNEVNWMSRILELELFQRIPPVNIQAMFIRFEAVEVEENEFIIEQDSPGDYYYVIKSGRCAIYRSNEDGSNPLQHKLAELGPGDSFGEEALVSDSPRNATVVMREAGELARLSKEDFLSLLKDPIMKSISFAEAEDIIANGGRYIDARTENEYRHNHLENSLNLPLSGIRESLTELDKSPVYVVYCDSGSRSAAACYILNQRGFVAHLLKNGLKSASSEKIQHPSQN